MFFLYETSVKENLDSLLAEIAKGNENALAQLYSQTRTAIYSFALSILKHTHDAEDVLHDCYLHIWDNAALYRPGKPMAWILTLTKNLCLQKLREYKRMADLPEEDWLPYLEAQPGLTEEDRFLLRECMESLSEEERHIVILHAVSGFKHREIAAFLELPLATVLSKYSRALKKLQKELGKENRP